MGGEVGVWFNGRWGRAARRIWLRTIPGGFEVQARQGDSDQPPRCWHLPDEMLARALVADLQQPDGDDVNDGWRDVTDLYRSRAAGSRPAASTSGDSGGTGDDEHHTDRGGDEGGVPRPGDGQGGGDRCRPG